MARYRIEGSIVDTENAAQTWEEHQDWDGNNHVSRATGSWSEHQRLYRSRRSRYYVERWSQWQGTRSSVEWISPQEATRWLLLNDHPLPDDLKQHEKEILE